MTIRNPQFINAPEVCPIFSEVFSFNIQDIKNTKKLMTYHSPMDTLSFKFFAEQSICEYNFHTGDDDAYLTTMLNR